MFEIYKRHTPMFATSDVKRIANAALVAYDFDSLELSSAELIPVFQTVRINENNKFVIKPRESVENWIGEHAARLSSLVYAVDPNKTIRRLIGALKAETKVDSLLAVGNVDLGEFTDLLPMAGASSQKPLLCFGEDFKATSCQLERIEWRDLDHIAIWLDGAFETCMEGAEAFFAISPALKIETGLNRYQEIASVGNFAAGMVRF